MDLTTGLDQLHLTWTSAQADKLNDYILLLSKWNKTYNLISPMSVDEIIPLHILDSLSVSNYLSGMHISDVGSGAGLPGIPLAILHPQRQFYLVESRSKRVAFLRQCQIELALPNVHVIDQRVSLFQPNPKMDCVVTRAFAQLHETIMQTAHLLVDHGILLAMQGLAPESAALEKCTALQYDSTIPLHVPGLVAARNLIKFVKKD